MPSEVIMNIEIKEVKTKKDLKQFIKVPFGIFKDNPNWVPPMNMDEMETFNTSKNPAFENCEAKLYIALQDGKPVGRVAAILSHGANNKFNSKNLRFGWFDTIKNYDVTVALMNKIEAWGKEKGMETLTGPQGFTDLDPEGMLVEGFDQLATIAVYYNHPYYPEYLEKYGFEKEIDYVEFKTFTPHKTGLPEKLLRIVDRIKERGGLRILEFKNKKELLSRGEEIFRLLDEAYEEIYGSYPLTDKQIQYYTKKYLPFVNKDMVKVVVNKDDEVVGFMISMPSFSEAFQKAKGKLFPFGWFHILRALKKRKIIDFYLAGVKKEYRGQGADLLMVMELAKYALKHGFLYGESNPELEDNNKIQAQWKPFGPIQHKRRRIFKKKISS